MQFDSQCKWPVDAETHVWKYMLKLNEVQLGKPYHGTIITFSHFLPRRDLPYKEENGVPVVKAIGCEGLEEQIRAVGSTCHVFGHTRCRYSKAHRGIMYAQNPIGTAQDRSQLADRSGDPPLLLIHNGFNLTSHHFPISG